MGGVEYQVTKVDPTDPETKGMVYQVHKVSEEIAATLGGKVYRARIIKDPTAPTVAGKVYQIVLIGDPDDPAVKGKVYNAILTGGSEAVVIGPAVSPLVLPDAIADSLSYVKAFGGTEQRNLPDGYTQLKYITFSGAQYIDTGLAINNNTRVLFDVKRSTSSAQSNYPWLGGVREYVNNTNINKKTLEFSKPDSTRLYLQYATSSEITLTVPDTTQRHTYDFDKNKLYVDENLIYTATQETFMGNTTFLIGTMYSQGSVSTASMFYGNVYGFKLWQDGTNLSMDLIPAKRNSDNVVGMYDLVSEQFFTNAGTGTFTAGADVVPTPDTPIDIVSNNGVLKVLESATGITTQAETPTPANPVPLVSYHKGSLILRSVGEYADSYDATTKEITRRVGVKVLDGTEDGWTKRNNSFSNNTLFADKKTGKSTLFCSHFQYDAGSTSTIPDGCIGTASTATTVYFRNDALSTVEDLKQWLADQYAAGIPVTVYYPLATETTETVGSFVYTDGTVETIEDTIGNTATAEMLLKVGDYQDVQSILDGVVTRKVGVKVLDGTENWQLGSSSERPFYLNNSIDGSYALPNTPFCTHFQGVASTVASLDIPDLAIRCGYAGYAKTLYIKYKSLYSGGVDAFKQYLADQYAAGTPVIVVYPLATETTESVAGQTLQVQAGNNTLEITQAGMDGLELEAEYTKVG